MKKGKEGLTTGGSGRIFSEPPPSPEPVPEPLPEDIPDFEAQVRAILGAGDDLIPNEVICLPLYKGRGLRYAKNVKSAESLKTPLDEEWDWEKIEHWRNIALYKTALLLVPYFRMQWKKTQQSPSLKEENFEIDWAAMEKQLRDNLEEETASLTGGSAGFSFFSVTNRGCGR